MGVMLVVVVAYTMLGGMYSVVLTDVVQFILIVVGVGIATFLIVTTAGGWARWWMRWSFITGGGILSLGGAALWGAFPPLDDSVLPQWLEHVATGRGARIEHERH